MPHLDADTTRVLLNLLCTYDVLDTYLSRRLAAYGLSRSAYNLLMILKASGEGGRPLHEIGELLLTSRANVTGLVDCLEHKGLVQRVPDKNDRRSRLAVLTDDGHALVGDVGPGYAECMRQVLDGLTPPEKQTLTELLVRLRESVTRAASAVCKESH